MSSAPVVAAAARRVLAGAGREYQGRLRYTAHRHWRTAHELCNAATDRHGDGTVEASAPHAQKRSLSEPDVGIGKDCLIPIFDVDLGASSSLPQPAAAAATITTTGPALQVGVLRCGFPFGVKHTAQDFVVDEIGPDGVVAAITAPLDLSAVAVAAAAAGDHHAQPGGAGGPVDAAADAARVAQARANLCELLTESVVEQIERLSRSGKSEFVSVPARGSKSDRGRIHGLLRALNAGLQSTTVVPPPSPTPPPPEESSSASTGGGARGGVVNAGEHMIHVWHKDHRPRSPEPEPSESTADPAPAPGSAQRRRRGRRGSGWRQGRSRGGRGSGSSQSNSPFAKRAPPWPYPGTDYLQFVLEKRNVDTLKALALLSRALGIHPSRFSYAGLKDSRARTSQFVTAKRLTPAQLTRGLAAAAGQSWYEAEQADSGAATTTTTAATTTATSTATTTTAITVDAHGSNSSKRSSSDNSSGGGGGGGGCGGSGGDDDDNAGRDEAFVRLRVGNATLVPDGQFIGNLAGNRFTLRLRGVAPPAALAAAAPAPAAAAAGAGFGLDNGSDWGGGARSGPHEGTSRRDVEACVRHWAARGFINYFGLQRFGNDPAASTHHVGRALLRKEFDQALHFVLRGSAVGGRGGSSNHHSRDNSTSGGDGSSGGGGGGGDGGSFSPCLPVAAVEAEAVGRKQYSPHASTVWSAMQQEHPRWFALCKAEGTGAVRRLPLTVCRDLLNYVPQGIMRLYLHAYQSYVWNSVVSDAVRAAAATAGPSHAAWCAELGLPPTYCDGDGAEFDATDSAWGLQMATPGKYAADAMSRHELQAVEAVLAVDGLALSDFVTPVLGRVQLSSFRRRVVLRPRDVAFSWLDDGGDSADANVEGWRQQERRRQRQGAGAGSGGGGCMEVLPDLQLQFRLPPGAYATCALRELSRRPIVWGSSP